MGFFDRSSEIPDTVRAAARLAVDVPKMLPASRCSPARLVEQWAKKQPWSLALAYQDQRFTWSDVNDRASQYAAWFAAHRIGHGDAVALVMDNRPDFIFIVSALSKLGGIAALINTNISGNALSHGINAAHPKMVLTGGEHLDRIDDPLYLLDGDGFAPIDAALFAQIQSGERKVS